MRAGMFIRLVLLSTACLACDSTAAQNPSESGSSNVGVWSADVSLHSQTIARNYETGGWSITAPVCTRSKARKIICGGASTGLGLYVGIPSARILYIALRADPSEEDPFGVGRSLRKSLALLAGSLVVLGGAMVYLGVDLLIDAFRPPTKYAFRPVAGLDGPGLSIRIRLP